MRTDITLPSEPASNSIIGWRALLPDHLILLLAIATSRWLFRSHSLYYMDSVNFALGMDYFSPVLHQPHPPGYYLYIKLAQLVQHVLPNPNDALVAISIAASCLAAMLTYQLAYAWFGRAAARWAGMLFMFSPLAWFHGTVALIYMVEAAMAALVGYLCWLTWCGRHTMIIPAAIVFGLAAGIRQSTALFLAPLLLLALWQTSWRHVLLALGICAVTLAAWFLPMLTESGGYTAYLIALNDIWSSAVVPTSVIYMPRSPLIHIGLLTIACVLCFGVGTPLLFVRGLPVTPPPGGWIFLAAWLIPGLLFFLIVYFPLVALGYALFLSIPLFAVLGAKIAALPVIRKGGNKRWLLILVSGAVHIGLFLYVPLYTSQAGVTRNVQELPQIEQGIRAIAIPEKTLVVVFEAYFYGFRHLGYSLPEYLVLSYPEHRAGVFAMQSRRTKILDKIPIGQYEQFVLYFPEARDVEIYHQYLPGFITGSVGTVSAGGYVFLTGPVSALVKIFPNTFRIDQDIHIQYHQSKILLDPAGIQMPTTTAIIR